MSVAAGCKPAPLPDQSSAGARLYVDRCGRCHVAYNPAAMTAPMWETQVTMMEVKIRNAGMEPLKSNEREAIVEYLRHNAGSQ